MRSGARGGKVELVTGVALVTTSRMPKGREGTVAGATRLELATSGVTGRRSNQLNYAPAKKQRPAAQGAPVASAASPHCSKCGLSGKTG